jgi:5-methylcytosine-specific restriction endonuclease McrA
VCGETDVEMLEFDHRHSKKFDISNGVSKGVSMHLLKKELAKCVVLCSNHHRKKTHAENNTWLHRLAKEGIN